MKALNRTYPGFSKNRLSKAADNPREVAFAEAWMRACEQSHIDSHLVPDLTVRDKAVAATVMQWLGSNVGMAFLCDVIDKSTEIKRFLWSNTR